MDGECCGDGAGKQHSSRSDMVGELMVLREDSIAEIAGGKLMCLQNMPEQTNESTNMFPHLFSPACPENT